MARNDGWHKMASQKNLLEVNIGGLKLKNPVMVASGTFGYGQEYEELVDLRQLGAIITKSITLAPYEGNPLPRIWETTAGMLNAIGLQNPGAHKVVSDYLPRLDFSETRYIANVSGSTVEEYAEVTRVFDDSPIDAIEINISCPNVKQGGVAFGNDPDMSARVVAACRAVTDKPIITKLSPNQTDIADNAQRCIDAGTDGFAVINTLMGMAIDVHKRKPVIGNNQGGLSGPAIKPIALLKVHQVYQVCKQHNIPIIGQGGVSNGQDALEFIIAGASAVGIGTGLYYNPLLCQAINEEICTYLADHQLSHISELVGSLELN